jgi:DNA-binding HxlR family transcriptional regulator
MSALVQSRASISATDPQHVEDALALITPKWTIWSAQILAQQSEPLRVRDIAARLPFISEQFVGKRLTQMHADGLVTRTDHRRGAPYQLSSFGAALAPLHQALADWSQDHLPLGPMAGAERVEDAVRRLNLRHSTTVIQALETGPMRFVPVANYAGLDSSYAHQRLVRLQNDGLVTRTGTRHGDPYVLTDAGRALGPVYAAVEYWSNPTHAPYRPAAAPVAAATRTRAEAAPAPEGIRTAAALRRSLAVPGGMFSHAPQPQPRVPAAVTARSAPAQGR